ncbi:Peptidase M1 membrane alanine aminopeptidase [Emticicia oligotrophica DSM 17448]|uniref:Peptidase M1 membrane alanine aminopeptidase n=1 Tax=Emticicia oligotrophica (strain DSM 17448 / CIP 109782 / MTCC 6937 / GPTSA100-15) TaxID=929562 RepID=A0ABM5N3I9_EMTOG|nr:M1 family metallopeptidase [Emticicia oligotrophica]AFK03936.1 Peptidase M1 membrane alanine aminopeptidase [Emticicia oligotrophica DSM 17448]
MPKFFKTIPFFLLSIISFAQTQPLSGRIANYDISVKLDPIKHTLEGKETLVWKNTSTDIISELQFHLYLNAFKNKNSTFMKESGGQLRGEMMDKKNVGNWGWIDVKSMKIRRGENLTSQIKFIQPDDLNDKDQTVISVKLNKPLHPNERITLDIDFSARLPKVFARTGYAGDYHLIGQWFPKIGVYETTGMRYAKRGQWNCHQFHADSEFYADFGVYNVSMTVPKNFVLAATGILQHEKQNSDNTKTIRYRAEDVHDFAWTVSPRFEVSVRQWKHVKIKAVVQPEHSGTTERFFQSAIAALEYFEKHLGKYPYTVLTLVDPPLAGAGSSGMEYPTFITCGETIWGLPKGIRSPEVVTIHEFGHQYFQGMLASNEFEESFLDEGFNQYFETRIMDATYGKGSMSNLLGFKINDSELPRISYVGMSNVKVTEIARESWRYPKGTYGIMTYMKTATMLQTLENLISKEVMDEVMQSYFIRWRFKHPSVKDFVNIVNEIAPKKTNYKFGKDFDWYFEQTLYNAPDHDYAVKEISGNKFTIERLGEMKIPTEILIKFIDGKEEEINWTGEDFSKTFNFKKDIQSVTIDPQNKILFDLNLNNNSKSINQSAWPFAKYALKIMFWLQNLLSFLG